MDKMGITEIGVQMTIREGVHGFKAKIKRTELLEV
jgi:hypothetical protein